MGKTAGMNSIFLMAQFLSIFLICAPGVIAQEEKQDSVEEGVVLEEIVVTAEKRPSTVMTTPLAISAFDQEALDRNGVAKTEDLTFLVPNFKFGDIDVGYGGSQLTIRGISNDNITNDGDPSIAVHMDGVYLPRISSSNALFHDVERVEVLRGPQGTLYGRNTTSGTVNVIPNRPGFSLERTGSLTFGSDTRLGAEGVFNAPIIDAGLAARVAFSYQSRDGYRENGPAPDGNDADDLSLRTSFLFTPRESTSLLLSADYFEQGGEGGTMAAVPYDRSNDPTGYDYPFVTDPQQFGLNTDPYVDNHDWGLKAELNHEFTGANLTWIATVRGHQRANRVDRDGTERVPTVAELMRFSGPFADTLPTTGPTTGNYAVLDLDSRSTSSELRLASQNDDHAFQWLLGLYYFKETQDSGFDAFVEGLRGAGFIAPFLGMPPPAAAADPAVRVKRFNDQTAESNAIFGQLSYRFGSRDQFRFTGGLRWTEDTKDDGDGSYAGFTLAPLTAPEALFREDVSFPIAGNAPVCVDENGQVDVYRCVIRDQRDSWRELTWKAGLDWETGRNQLLYLSASRGFRSGGFNDSNVYAPEFNDALEVGAKGRFLHGRGSYDLALFHYDFKDQQVSQVENASTVTQNAGASTIMGLELVTSILPTPTSRLDVTVALLDATYDVFENVDDPQTPGVILEDLSGNSLIKAPEQSLNLSWEPHQFHFVGGGVLTPIVQLHYESEYYLLAFNNPQNLQGSHTRTDARLKYTSARGRWSVEAWVKNIEDDDVLAAQFTTPNRLLTPPQAVGFPPGAGREELLLGSYAPPRSFGITFRVR